MEAVHAHGKGSSLVIDETELIRLMSQMERFKDEVEDFLEEMEMLRNKETVKGIEESLGEVKKGRVHKYRNIKEFKEKFKLQ